MECTDHHKYSNKRFYALQTGNDALWESKNKKTLDFCIRCKNGEKKNTEVALRSLIILNAKLLLSTKIF